MRIESLVVLFLIGSSGCSLLAPSDSELSGAWGIGGRGGFPGSGTAGQANDAEPASGADSGGSESMPNGGAPDAGESGSDTGPSAGKSAGGTGGVAGAGVGKGGTGGVAGAGVGKGGTGASSGGTLGAAGAGGSGKVAGAGGGSGGVAGAHLANGGAGASSGGTLGTAGVGGAGKVAGAGAGGAVSYCAAKPCVRGTCSEVTKGYKCTCPAGWGGTTCAVGSCSTLSCPASAPCRVPEGNVAVCYPSACVSMTGGLCMAENADGSGDAILIAGHNGDFNPLSGSNWTNRAKYFGYLDSVHGDFACVFPQPGDSGTPLVIPLNSVRTKTTGFGQSNSWPNPPTCSK